MNTLIQNNANKIFIRKGVYEVDGEIDIVMPSKSDRRLVIEGVRGATELRATSGYTGKVFNIVNSDIVKIENLVINPINGIGIYIENSHRVEIKDVWVFSGTGVYIRGYSLSRILDSDLSDGVVGIVIDNVSDHTLINNVDCFSHSQRCIDIVNQTDPAGVVYINNLNSEIPNGSEVIRIKNAVAPTIVVTNSTLWKAGYGINIENDTYSDNTIIIGFNEFRYQTVAAIRSVNHKNVLAIANSIRDTPQRVIGDVTMYYNLPFF